MRRAVVSRLVVAATLVAGSAGAQEGTPSGATPSSEGKAAVKLTKAPVLVHPVQPEFPAGEGQGATVVLAVTLGTDGAVKDVSVLQTGGAAFDEAAMRAA
ncbi:MAG TPA: TonB family protein, partial [Polyangiaceae bacterium]